MALKAVKRFLLYRKVRLVRSKNRSAILVAVRFLVPLAVRFLVPLAVRFSAPLLFAKKTFPLLRVLQTALSEYSLTARNVQS